MGTRVGIVATVGALALATTGVGAISTTQPASAGSSPALIAFDDDANGIFEFTPSATIASPTLIVPAGVFPTFSPSGSQLAYEVDHAETTADPNGYNTIVVAGRTGTAPHVILTGPISWNGSTSNDVEYPLAWSPNGKELAYGCDGNTESDNNYHVAQVCVVNVDTGAHHMITESSNLYPLDEHGGTNQRLSWTPDGTHIIATVRGDSADCVPGQPTYGECQADEIGSINVGTGKVQLLTTIKGSLTSADNAALSPDGKSIVYLQNASTVPDDGVAVMSSGGGGEHIIYTTYGSGHIEPDPLGSLVFSPNGKDILFSSFGPNPTETHYREAFLIAADGSGQPVELTGDDYNVYDASWTPILTTCTVPKLKGDTLKKAKTALQKAGCTLGKVSGPKKNRKKLTIKSQNPKAGKDEPDGTKVNVTLKAPPKKHKKKHHKHKK